MKPLLLPLFLILFFPAFSAEPEPLHVHLISGSNEYRSKDSLKAFQRHLESEFLVNVTASWVGDKAEDLPEIGHLPDADLLLVFARRLNLPEAQMKVVRAHWEAGKPVVGIRTASHAFQKDDNEVFDRKVMGGHYAGHFGDGAVEIKPTATGKKHPVVEGVGPITSKKLYKAGALAESATVLQTGTLAAQDETHPVTWTHTWKGGRTFYTSLGVSEDFACDNFRRLLTNAIWWTAEKDPAAYRR